MVFGNATRLFLLSAAPAAALLGGLKQKIKEEEPELELLQRETSRKRQNPKEQVQRAREAVHRHMAITGAPGLSVGISKNGKCVWAEGFGFADVESGAKCTAQSVMRIASISKPLTAAIAGHLVERGKLDLDQSIHNYLPAEDFPKKSFNGKEVSITARQLLSHTSGVRHYPKKDELASDTEDTVEFMSNRRFKSVREALEMFKEDPLLCEPGTQYHYTTHGFTLLSAVLEKAEGREFKEQLAELFRRLDMGQTFLDDAQEPIVLHRTSYYKRNDKSHRLENVREVDNSYKLAGGGILSNVSDLLKFANAILHCYQSCPALQEEKPLFLRPETIRQQWTKHSECFAPEGGKKLGEYGLGWSLAAPNGWDQGMERADGGGHFEKRKYWFHTGGAVGASSILLIKPAENGQASQGGMPQGICIAILVNCQDCSCERLAQELVDIFEREQTGNAI